MSALRFAGPMYPGILSVYPNSNAGATGGVPTYGDGYPPPLLATSGDGQRKGPYENATSDPSIFNGPYFGRNLCAKLSWELAQVIPFNGMRYQFTPAGTAGYTVDLSTQKGFGLSSSVLTQADFVIRGLAMPTVESVDGTAQLIYGSPDPSLVYWNGNFYVGLTYQENNAGTGGFIYCPQQNTTDDAAGILNFLGTSIPLFTNMGSGASGNPMFECVGGW
jgi:hypothetical protein